LFERSGSALFVFCTAAQLVLGTWRAQLTGSSLSPALALAALIAGIGVLWLAHRREWRGGFLARPAALVLATIGALSAVSAMNAPLIPVIAKVTTPLFALAAAAVLVAARLEPRWQIATLTAFATSVLLLEIALMNDARWQAAG
jgi:hypothetical protein